MLRGKAPAVGRETGRSDEMYRVGEILQGYSSMSVLWYNDGRDYETPVVYAVFVSVLRLGEMLQPSPHDEILCHVRDTP